MRFCSLSSEFLPAPIILIKHWSIPSACLSTGQARIHKPEISLTGTRIAIAAMFLSWNVFGSWCLFPQACIVISSHAVIVEQYGTGLLSYKKPVLEPCIALLKALHPPTPPSSYLRDHGKGEEAGGRGRERCCVSWLPRCNHSTIW